MVLPHIHILLVDDDRPYVRVARHSLRRVRPDCRLSHVPDGEEALDYVFGRGAYADRVLHPLPDLILLDLRMPRVDGFEVLRQLKTEPQIRCIPVVVMTSSDQPSDQTRCAGYGADLFLTKPADWTELFRLIEPQCAAGAKRSAPQPA